MLDILTNAAKGRDARGNPSMTLVACMLATVAATVCLVVGGNTYPVVGTIASLDGMEYAAILAAIGTGWTVREYVDKKAKQ